MLEWNVHKIRSSRNSIMPFGRPCIMYEMPTLFQTKSYLLEVPTFAIDALATECTILKFPCDEDFYRLCNIIMLENGLSHKCDPYDAVELYSRLRTILKDIYN